MNTALPADVLPDYFEKLETHILQEFADGVAAWGQSVTALARWEDEHLLDNPTPDALAAHRRTVERLIQFGRFLALTTEHPDFPDVALKQNVAAERDTCEPEHRDRCERTLRRLVEDALQRVPNASRQQFLDALGDCYRLFLRARRKPTTLPLKA